MKTPKVSKKELLRAFERLCKEMGVVSKGFDHKGITAPCDGDKYDGQPQWAMKKVRGLGWMVVSGWKGIGCPLTRFNGYIKGRWNFLMMMEAVSVAVRRLQHEAGKPLAGEGAVNGSTSRSYEPRGPKGEG